ncbi:MAG: pyridoxamine 5'-phosphate oxidase family protein [Candidatus Limnocylindrales bacterium]
MPVAAAAVELLETERRGTLVTVDDDGRPRPTPFCFVLSSEGDRLVLHTPIDEKPKGRSAPDDLPRIRDIRVRPGVVVLIDRWDEDWTKLAWAVLHGTASVLLPGDPATDKERARAIAALRERYPQYAGHDLEARPMIRIDVDSVRSWDAAALSGAGTAPTRSGGGSGSTPSPGGNRRR